ncbi:MAG TPA: RNA polymerase sigma factor [Candidatus Paceibacterota bacterium]
MIQSIVSFSRETAAALSDDEVLKEAQGNSEAFAVLVARYEAPFLRRARSILWSPEDAEEAVQDAFTRIYLYADRYRKQEGATFSSWAYTILNRVAYTRYRTRRIEGKARTELTSEHYESLADESRSFLEDLSVRNEVLAALALLPEKAARVLRLQFIEGKTQEEIAGKEGSTVSAIKTQVHRAKKLFKLAYERQSK